MTLLITRILFALLLVVSLPLPLHAQETGEFVVFIHTGPRNTNDPLVLKIATSLVQRGFIVRAPDSLRITDGNPRVDYFSESAYKTARMVADLVNDAKRSSALSGDLNRSLTPQLQIKSGAEGYLGVWLF
jgi:hypothetical protein